MPDYRDIYATQAERYHTLVSAEDHRGALREALRRLVSLDGARAIEVGVGTGRLTRLMIEAGAFVTGYERSPAMLAVARRVLGANCFVAHAADIRHVQLPPASATLAIAGWVLGHFCEWHADHWQGEIHTVLTQLWAALEPGGTLAIIETLGTGSQHAAAPDARLAAYYRWLESSWGLERQELRTDYQFETVEAAAESIGFFFGAELERRVRERAWSVVPEWTGLWARRK